METDAEGKRERGREREGIKMFDKKGDCLCFLFVFLDPPFSFLLSIQGRKKERKREEGERGRREEEGEDLFSTNTALESEKLLELVVEDEDDGTAGAADGVGESALEERADAFLAEDL